MLMCDTYTLGQFASSTWEIDCDHVLFRLTLRRVRAAISYLSVQITTPHMSFQYSLKNRNEQYERERVALSGNQFSFQSRPYRLDFWTSSGRELLHYLWAAIKTHKSCQLKSSHWCDPLSTLNAQQLIFFFENARSITWHAAREWIFNTNYGLTNNTRVLF